jgi:hypothetical protein
VNKAKIEINPKYGTFDKDGNSPGVVPPSRPADATSTTIGIGPVQTPGAVTPP